MVSLDVKHYVYLLFGMVGGEGEGRVARTEVEGKTSIKPDPPETWTVSS